MEFKSLLTQRQKEIIEEWIKKTLELYPAEAFNFLLTTKDAFHNPIGQSYQKNLPQIYISIINEDEQLLQSSLSEILKIRAVQCESLSEGLQFLIILKDIILNLYTKVNLTESNNKTLLETLNKIDWAMMKAGDLFLQDKELIYEIKSNEVVKRFEKIVDRLNQRLEKQQEIEDKTNI